MIWCKLEFLNPSGSTKDRIANFILSKALRRGEIAPGGTVVEASSGSTSIAMALAAAQMGLRFVAVMPEGVSRSGRLIIESYGGEVVFSPRAEGIRGALLGAAREAAERGGFQPLQFSNPDNPGAHRHQTAQEIIAQIPGGCVDAVVSGVGTGGTLVGLWQGFADFGCAGRRLRRPAGDRHGARRRRVLLVQRPDSRRGRRPLGDLRRFPAATHWSSSTCPTTRPSRWPGA